jgi:hypothetical protein
MGRIRRLMAVALGAIVVAGCGGGSTAPEERTATIRAAATLDASALMDWAEAQYPGYFPAHAPNQSATVGPDLYTYRAYQANGITNLLGVTTGGRVDVLLPQVTGAAPFTVGTLADFICRVYVCGSVTGTAAAGAPIAGATVSLKDAAGHTVTATTSVTGAYTLDTTGLSGPFLLQVTTAGGQRLYGVTADPAPANVANLTPLTDLIVRSWYAMQGVAVDTAFANPSAAPPPTAQQTTAVANAVLSVMQLALNNANAGVAAPLDLITKAFSADHTGLDAVLDATSIVYGSGAAVSIGGAVQQTSLLSYDTLAGSITTSSTAVSGGNTSSSTVTVVVPRDAAQVDAMNQIQALMNQFAAVVTARGTNLVAADLSAFLDPDLLSEGFNADQFAAALASDLGQGQALGIAVQAISTLDVAGGSAEVKFAATETLDGQSTTNVESFFFRQRSGGWLLSGDRRIARVEVQAEARTDQGALPNATYSEVIVGIRAPQNTLSSVAVAGGAGSISMRQNSSIVDDSGLLLDSFFGTTGALAAGSRPAAGTVYTVTLNRPSAGPVVYAVPLNAFTTEAIAIASPTGSTLADAHLGGSLNVSWHLPTTYAVRRISLSALVFTGLQDDPATFQCESAQAIVGVAATSGTLNVPATCNGLPVLSVNLNLAIDGIDGERSNAVYLLR